MVNLDSIENLNNAFLKETGKVLSKMRDYTAQKKIQKKINKIID